MSTIVRPVHTRRSVASAKLASIEKRAGVMLPGELRAKLLDRWTREGGHLDRLARGVVSEAYRERLDRLHEARETARRQRNFAQGDVSTLDPLAVRSRCMPRETGAGEGGVCTELGSRGVCTELGSRESVCTEPSSSKNPRGPAARGASLAASAASDPPAVRRASGVLDNTTDKVSLPRSLSTTLKVSAAGLPGYQEHRRRVNLLRRTVQRLTASQRVKGCGMRADGDVGIRQTDTGAAHFTGFRTCGRAWLCARCAGTIGAERADELHRGMTRHLEAGGHLLFLTLTIPHDDGDELRPMLRTVARGFTAILAGRAFARWRREYGIIGTVRTLECTHGAAGWHPHLHVLVFTEGQFTQRERARFRRYAFGVWRRTLEAAGRRAPQYRFCPLRVVNERGGMAAYLTKVAAAYEMTGWHRKRAKKGGRTFFDIVAAVAGGDRSPATLALVHEWERATYRARALTWSHGLKRRLIVAEKSDEEIAAKEVGGDDLLLLTPALFRSLVEHDPRGPDDLLETIERGGVRAGVELLESLPVWLPGAAIKAVYDGASCAPD